MRKAKGKEPGSAKDFAAASLARRALSKKALKDKLTERGFDEDTACETADWFEKLGYINDEAYAGALISRFASRGWGALRMKNELLRRGIDAETAQNALKSAPADLSAAEKIVCKKLGGRAADRAELKKLSGYLFRRGFSWETIQSAINRYVYTEDAD